MARSVLFFVGMGMSSAGVSLALTQNAERGNENRHFSSFSGPAQFK
jgi:hypothetical protein